MDAWPQVEQQLQDGEWGMVLSQCQALKQFLDLNPQYKKEYEQRYLTLVREARIMRFAFFQFDIQHFNGEIISFREVQCLLSEIDEAINHTPEESYFYYIRARILLRGGLGIFDRISEIEHPGIRLLKEKLKTKEDVFSHFLYVDCCVENPSKLTEREQKELSDFLEEKISVFDAGNIYSVFFLYCFMLIHHRDEDTRVQNFIAERKVQLSEDVQHDLLKSDELRKLYITRMRNMIFKQKNNIWMFARKYYEYIRDNAFKLAQEACQLKQPDRFNFLKKEHDVAFNSLDGFKSRHTREEWDGLEF